MNDEEIPYRSPAAAAPAERVSTADEQDFSTIKQLLILIEEAEKSASDISQLDAKHPKFSLEQQIIGKQFALDEVILPLKSLLIDTIGEVKLKQRGE